MKIYDDSNYQDLLGDGQAIYAGGDKRILAAMPKPYGYDASGFSKPFADVVPVIPRSEWSARIAEQKSQKRRVSDFQKFKSHDQNGLPSCWRNGPAHAATTARVMQGLPLVYISSCSLCPDISPRVGGYEGNAIKSLVQDGGASFEVWPNNDTNMRRTNQPEVIESRKHHHALEVYECDGFDQFATACLLGFPIAVAFSWWSHVISGGDLVELERGSFGICYRNNWGEDYGDKNEYGFGGYVTFREGKGTPDSGWAIRQVTQSVA